MIIAGDLMFQTVRMLPSGDLIELEVVAVYEGVCLAVR